MPPNTIRQNLSDSAKRGIINFKLSRSTEEMGNWRVINYVLEACNDDKIIRAINKYHERKDE